MLHSIHGNEFITHERHGLIRTLNDDVLMCPIVIKNTAFSVNFSLFGEDPTSYTRTGFGIILQITAPPWSCYSNDNRGANVYFREYQILSRISPSEASHYFLTMRFTLDYVLITTIYYN